MDNEEKCPSNNQGGGERGEEGGGMGTAGID